MSLDAADAQALVREGMAALARGDGGAARRALQPIADTGRASRDVLLLLADACRREGDREAALGHLDAVLRKDGTNLRALLAKAELRQDDGDVLAAHRLYRSALSAAATDGFDPALGPALARAQEATAANQGLFSDYLERSLQAAGHGPGARTARFQLALDILNRRVEPDMGIQRPAVFFMPGMPQRSFYERDELPWSAAFETHTDAIRAELARQEEASFRPYLLSDPDAPRRDFHGLLDNPDWSTLYLWENGAKTPAGEACPETFAALEPTPLCHIGARAPSVLFSLLKPGARIPAHSGVTNARLICHLPLEVPPDCGFRVGVEVREWREGELLAFDDSVEHEAWNGSGERRVVLIFDVWRPELEPAEREAVAAMFAAIDSF